jgi:multidrug efflux pump subunit AcrA (membrane-fusion protein)
VALALAPGQQASVSVRELAGRVFKGRVERAAPALDPSSRTRLIEVRIDNAEGTLLPGMFAECTFSVPRPGQETLVPGEAILIRDGRAHVAAIDDAGDLGSAVELRAGATPGERLAVSLARQPAEGAKVETVEKKD